MTSRRSGQRSAAPASLLGWLIPLVVVGLSIADFARDGQIDKFLIGALLIFGLGALGWRLDDIVGEKAAEQVESGVRAIVPGGDTPGETVEAKDNGAQGA